VTGAAEPSTNQRSASAPVAVMSASVYGDGSGTTCRGGPNEYPPSTDRADSTDRYGASWREPE